MRLQVGTSDELRGVNHALHSVGFELARSIFNGTTWLRDRHSRIAAITEVPGVWVE
jgi:hypothetical protein